VTPARLRGCLDLLHWTPHALGEVLDVAERQVRYWLTGRAPVPEPIAAWLERRAEAMTADPPPARRAA